MHIPDGLLQGKICPVTAVISSFGIAAAIWTLIKKEKKPVSLRFAAAAALIFALQAINFPILNGISGHVVGGVLAAQLLGLPLGILAMSIVIAIQCLLFSDGGMTVLGANIFNMAILGTIAGDQVRVFLSGRLPDRWNWIAAMAASWLSVMVGALSVGVELTLAGWQNIFSSLMGAHALIGVGEAAITLAASIFLMRYQRMAAPLAMAALAALFISPFASAYPDGLEWTLQKAGFFNETASPGLSIDCGHEMISTSIAAFLGVLATFSAAYLLRFTLYISHLKNRFGV